jgi:hypothetical protein
MEDTRTIVRAGLDELKPHLRSYLERELKRAYGEAYAAHERKLVRNGDPDVQALLSAMADHWDRVFSKKLRYVDWGRLHELKQARNLWAHEQPISLDQAYRSLDTMELFLEAIEATDARASIAEFKNEVRLRQVAELTATALAEPPRDTRSRGAAPESAEQRPAGAADNPAVLSWLGDEGERLRIAFTKVFGSRFRPFGNRSRRYGGLSDHAQGVQWNAGYDPRDGRQWVGVNLEGMKYDDWPIARLLEREIANPSLLQRLREHPGLERVIVLWRRDYWPASNRAEIREEGILRAPLGSLTPDQWRLALEEAIHCLDENRGHRGRGRQTVTLMSGVRKEGAVSPHLTFEYEASGRAAWEAFFREARTCLEPFHQWTTERAAGKVSF